MATPKGGMPMTTTPSKVVVLDEIEHIRRRPDAFAGSVTPEDGISDAFKNICNEIFTNASDHYFRTRAVKHIDVTVGTNTITVRNDGPGISAAAHPELGVPEAEIVFSYLRSSTNYDDTEKRTWGGRNGLGAKVTNIFSTKFAVESVCAGTSFLQTWTNGMTATTGPVVKPVKGGGGAGKEFTRIEWTPDLGALGFPGLREFTPEMTAWLTERVNDLVCVLDAVRVTLNGVDIGAGGRVRKDTFARTVAARFGVEDIFEESPNDRWDVAVADNPGDKKLCVSWVNGMRTPEGGTHVNYILRQIHAHLLEQLQKKKKEAKLTMGAVERGLALFVRCSIENPVFSTQTKECLKTSPKDFGSECVLSPGFLKKLSSKLGILTRLEGEADAAEVRAAAKTDGRKIRVITDEPKLVDAKLAGTKDSAKCTLILTEGDSAKTLVVGGMTAAQRDVFGVYPLVGKILNVKDASKGDIHSNKVIAAIKKIMGLDMGAEYKDVRRLRYGRLMVMTDQDYDGSHIRGLIMNLFHTEWPSLLRIPGFLTYMATPLVKAFPAGGVVAGAPPSGAPKTSAKKKPEVKAFYSMTEYEAWRATLGPSEGAKWNIQYYKGLGTHTKDEAKEYFLRPMIVAYEASPGTDEALQLAFGKSHKNDRKKWLLDYDPAAAVLDVRDAAAVPIPEFVHKDLVNFSYYDLVRSIPSLMDGLKVSQRKVLFAALSLKGRVKVGGLVSQVVDKTHYHHGEASVVTTIVNMAQSFVGANNIPLLVEAGQFGSRLEGGHDAAQPRYIFTDIHPRARLLFPADDFPVLDYEYDDGVRIEPKWYAPVLPMLLVNGTKGIGTGFSTNTPCWNPVAIAEYIRARLDGRVGPADEWDPDPYYVGFKGSIAPRAEDCHKWDVQGIVSKVPGAPDTVRITELPVGTWTTPYIAFLAELAKEGKVEEYFSSSSDVDVDITVRIPGLAWPDSEPAPPAALLKMLRLTDTIDTGNMHVWGPDGKICKVDSAKEVVDIYMPVRLALYGKRKAHLLSVFQAEIARHAAIMQFIDAQLTGALDMRNMPTAALKEAIATRLGIPDLKHDGWDFLLSLPLRSLTAESVARHREALASLQVQHDTLARKSPEDLWREDLDALLTALVSP